jgi:hypothetical protein
MSFLNWFSSAPSPLKPSPAEEQKRAAAGRDKSPPSIPGRLPVEAAAPGDGAKLKRHARREQLYVAIRESMTRSGVLSASYKFKVLSLDQRGNEFLVMMDLAKAFGRSAEQLSEIETLIIQNAKARFEITVPAVYWRIDETAVVVKPRPPAEAVPSGPAPLADAAAKPVKPPTSRYEPIQADEVAAFKQALMAASAQGPAAGAENNAKDKDKDNVSVKEKDKSKNKDLEKEKGKDSAQGKSIKSGPRSYALLTGFEDTEMPPDSPSSPALSSTQYGDLI